jgi:hypothetical protein
MSEMLAENSIQLPVEHTLRQEHISAIGKNQVHRIFTPLKVQNVTNCIIAGSNFFERKHNEVSGNKGSVLDPMFVVWTVLVDQLNDVVVDVALENENLLEFNAENMMQNFNSRIRLLIVQNVAIITS